MKGLDIENGEIDGPVWGSLCFDLHAVGKNTNVYNRTRFAAREWEFKSDGHNYARRFPTVKDACLALMVLVTLLRESILQAQLEAGDADVSVHCSLLHAVVDDVAPDVQVLDEY